MEKIIEKILEIKGNTGVFSCKIKQEKKIWEFLEWKRNHPGDTQRWWMEQAGETDPDTGEAEIAEWEGKELSRD